MWSAISEFRKIEYRTVLSSVEIFTAVLYAGEVVKRLYGTIRPHSSEEETQARDAYVECADSFILVGLKQLSLGSDFRWRFWQVSSMPMSNVLNVGKEFLPFFILTAALYLVVERK